MIILSECPIIQFAPESEQKKYYDEGKKHAQRRGKFNDIDIYLCPYCLEWHTMEAPK